MRSETQLNSYSIQAKRTVRRLIPRLAQGLIALVVLLGVSGMTHAAQNCLMSIVDCDVQGTDFFSSSTFIGIPCAVTIAETNRWPPQPAVSIATVCAQSLDTPDCSSLRCQKLEKYEVQWGSK
jgi:hypothetical protein